MFVNCEHSPFNANFQSGQVECEREQCESLIGCPTVYRPKGPSSCCLKCLHCTYAAIERSNNERWTSNEDSCVHYLCKGGVVTSWRIRCFDESADGPRREGYCCRLRTQPPAVNDPCIQCEALYGGLYHCYLQTCPLLDCPPATHYKPVNSCCPECKHPSNASSLAVMPYATRAQCVFRNKRYELGESFRVDACSLCQCLPGGVHCRKFVCPFKQCEPSRIFYKINFCCSFCRTTAIAKPSESPPICRVIDADGRAMIIQDTERWHKDKCTQCVCDRGNAKCERERCEWHGRKCPRGYKLKHIAGKCCPTCDLREGTCTVFGDPHYLTFDRASFSIRGSCNYILTQDCALRG
ncbi:hypothetical protein AB6A40_008362 [Gnathostoma spinigerum]|uniref:VWFC domain-containing protein n=1 Tax=Gnathostoma spinigerum TaxID=75299 RepID=A0ABD6ENW7_9BILA